MLYAPTEAANRNGSRVAGFRSWVDAWLFLGSQKAEQVTEFKIESQRERLPPVSANRLKSVNGASPHSVKDQPQISASFLQKSSRSATRAPLASRAAR